MKNPDALVKLDIALEKQFPLPVLRDELRRAPWVIRTDIQYFTPVIALTISGKHDRVRVRIVYQREVHKTVIITPT